MGLLYLYFYVAKRAKQSVVTYCRPVLAVHQAKTGRPISSQFTARTNSLLLHTPIQYQAKYVNV